MRLKKTHKIFGIRRDRRRGFTAVEIAMVATVIAIIALLILPIYRQRVEAARQAAVVDEMSSIAKAQLLIEADTGMQARLQDLDNTMNPDLSQQQVVPFAVPIAAWNGTLAYPGVPVDTDHIVPKSRGTLIASEGDNTGWQGPYAAYKNYKFVRDLEDFWFNVNDELGFIYVVGNGTGTPLHDGTQDNVDLDRYPVDPWGSPYVFYGRGRFAISSSTESSFNSSVIYSLGPNGLPGDDFANAPALYERVYEDQVIGDPETDDHEYRF